MYVILNLLFNKNLLFCYYGKNSKSLWINHRLVLLTRQFGVVDASKGCQVCHKILYGSKYIRKYWQTTTHFSPKKKETIPWSSHESWRPCQETWRPCRHHGMIMTMFRHDHGMAAMFFQPGLLMNNSINNICNKILVLLSFNIFYTFQR